MKAESMSKMNAAARKFFEELRRRKVFRIAVAYAVVAWIVIQIAANTFPALHLPAWSITLVVILTILGFPLALVLAWSLEITPQGIRVDDAPGQRSAEQSAKPASRVTRLAPSQRRAALAPVISVMPADEVPDNDPLRAKRAVLARLRHDLRTPMNAILGYSEVLVEEARELGIEPVVPDVQRLHAAAKRLLEQMDVHLPAGIDLTDAEPASIRERLRDALTSPADALLDQARQLRQRAMSYPNATADLDHIVSAAEKAAAAVAALASAPAAAEETAPGSGFERVFRGASAGQTPAGAAHAGTLLVVDDNALNRDLLTRQLARDGYNVFTAASGREALEKLRLHDIDLILLDVLMPEMDGIQVLEAIQRNAQLAEIPVVMISALDEMDAVARCIEKGAMDYLAKPFDPVLLRARVSVTLQLRALRGELRHSEDALAQSRASAAQLAGSVAPAPFAEEVAKGERLVSAHYPEVTAVVVRLEGLDAIASRSGPEALLTHAASLLALCDRCSREKNLTIARMSAHSYAVLAGAPEWHERHAETAAEFAFDVLRACEAGASASSERPQIRIGIHTGAAIAGVLTIAGSDKLAFGLWGDAVATAEAIACQSAVGRVQVSASSSAKLNQKFALASPAMIEVPGQGHLRTYVLESRATAVQ